MFFLSRQYTSTMRGLPPCLSTETDPHSTEQVSASAATRLWICILDPLGSNLDRDTTRSDIIVRAFSQSLQENSEITPRSEHGAFLPNPFQFTNYPTNADTNSTGTATSVCQWITGWTTGESRFDSLAGIKKILLNVQTSPRNHPASYPKFSGGSFTGVNVAET
jgi:hypothetical protein